MSAQAEKVLRRDLRRAVGAEAISAIDHNAKIVAALQQQVDKHREFNAYMTRAVDDRYAEFARWTKDCTALLEDLQMLARSVEARHLQLRHSFWRRLRWLVTGQ